MMSWGTKFCQKFWLALFCDHMLTGETTPSLSWNSCSSNIYDSHCDFCPFSEIPLVLFDSEFGDEFEWIYEAGIVNP